MKKNRFIKVLTFMFAIGVASSTMVVQANAAAPKKHVTANNVVAADEDEKAALEAVLALYTDNTFTTIKEGITMQDIFNAHKLVDKLSDSELKHTLNIYILKAQIQYNERKAKVQVYALYKDEEHTIITDYVTQKEIAIARASVENLPAEALRVQLRVLVMIAQVQLDSREATYALFADDTHNTIKADLKQADIDKAKALVDALKDNWPIKEDLSILIFKAQYQFNHQEARQVVYGLFKDSAHTIIRDDLKLADIIHARALVEALPPGAIKVEFRILIIDAQDQFDARETVYALFADDTHTTIKADLKQADIDKAKELVDSLPDRWPIKAELNQLIVLAQSQLDERK